MTEIYARYLPKIRKTERKKVLKLYEEKELEDEETNKPSSFASIGESKIRSPQKSEAKLYPY